MSAVESTPLGKLRVPAFFALWYALNVIYNVSNKWALVGVEGYVAERTSHSSPLPFTIGCLQFGIGAAYACALWVSGLRRPVPHAEALRSAATTCRNFVRGVCRAAGHLGVQTSQGNNIFRGGTGGESHSPSSVNNLRHTFHIAVHHTLGQLCTVISLSTNSISFAHVIKAMEPFFSAIASRVVLGQRMDYRVYLSLIPVVGGVVMACAGSREFSWISFWSGMGSNACELLYWTMHFLVVLSISI